MAEAVKKQTKNIAKAAVTQKEGSSARATEGVLELPNVIRHGVDFSPELKSAEASLKYQSTQSLVAERSLFPKVSAELSNRFNKNPVVYTATSNSTITTTSAESYSAAIKLNQPLYKGGLLTAGIGSFDLAREIARQKVFSARQNAIKALISTYYDLAQAQEQLQVTTDQRQVLKTYADIVSRYVQIGRSRKMDQLQASVNLSLTEAELVKVDQQRTLASDSLKRLLGMPEGGQPLAGRLQITIAPAEPVDFQEAIRAAEANYPEFQIPLLEREKQSYDNDIDISADKPSLEFVGEWGYKAPDRPTWFDESSRYYSVGLNLSIPLFSGLTSVAKRQGYVQQNLVKEKAVETARLNLHHDLQQALVSLKNEFGHLTSAQTAVKQGREALELANNGYRQGTVSSQDVLNAQRSRYDAEKLLIDSQFAYLRALLDVRRLMGVDLEKVYEK